VVPRLDWMGRGGSTLHPRLFTFRPCCNDRQPRLDLAATFLSTMCQVVTPVSAIIEGSMARQGVCERHLIRSCAKLLRRTSGEAAQGALRMHPLNGTTRCL
jgi:hypothetical protein